MVTTRRSGAGVCSCLPKKNPAAAPVPPTGHGPPNHARPPPLPLPATGSPHAPHPTPPVRAAFGGQAWGAGRRGRQIRPCAAYARASAVGVGGSRMRAPPQMVTAEPHIASGLPISHPQPHNPPPPKGTPPSGCRRWVVATGPARRERPSASGAHLERGGGGPAPDDLPPNGTRPPGACRVCSNGTYGPGEPAWDRRGLTAAADRRRSRNHKIVIHLDRGNSKRLNSTREGPVEPLGSAASIDQLNRYTYTQRIRGRSGWGRPATWAWPPSDANFFFLLRGPAPTCPSSTLP